ncbi:uncharacterized protein LOC119431683 isoform X2 [Dermacentor silvarum]|nr:uncharacterized protein LOC119431683 isoform X2 [Dermacentor silvarum]
MAGCQVCRPHSIEACYGAIAMSLLRDLVKPPFGEIELDASMQTICGKRFPGVSRCLSLVNDCPKERRENFTNLENIYRGFHNAVCTQDSFDGLRGLWDCLDRPRRKKCDKDTDDLLGAGEYSTRLHCQIARNYSVCLEEVTTDCPPKFGEGKKALKRIADGAVDTLCSSWRDLQTRSSEASPSVTGSNEPFSTPQFSSSTAVQAVGVMTTPSLQVEGNTTTSMDLFEGQHVFTMQQGDTTTIHSLLNGSTKMTSELPHAAVTSQIPRRMTLLGTHPCA